MVKNEKIFSKFFLNPNKVFTLTIDGKCSIITNVVFSAKNKAPLSITKREDKICVYVQNHNTYFDKLQQVLTNFKKQKKR